MAKSQTLVEVARDADQVLIPSRYQKPFIEAYQSLTGIEIPEMKGRKMSVCSNGKIFRWMRGRDIPGCTARANVTNPNMRTIGLTGSEWCDEYAASTNGPDLPWNRIGEKLGCLAVISNIDDDVELTRARLKPGFEPLGVATAFPNFVKALSKAGEWNITLRIPVQGCAESVAELFNIPAVDLVSTGATLAANNFVVLQELRESYPALVAPSATWGEQE
ncbi:hypothetical protein TM7_0279 [candidate division TM7 genomosp. GTL1]|nr:hypothetical protein TM7_0279 [candidate division TM7 genomosp. GTL1]